VSAPAPMTIVRLYYSPEHVYSGHFGQAAGTEPMVEVGRARLVAGRGIEGDRYYKREGAKGQVTFFAEETWLRLCRDLGRTDRHADVFRRNVIVRGIDLNSLIGVDFELQGVRFHGVEHCKPCVWMDEAFGPGTLRLLSEWKAGGLRTRVLSEGWLSTGTQEAEKCSA
jgi:MOSC domain-containing protein YiiM